MGYARLVGASELASLHDIKSGESSMRWNLLGLVGVLAVLPACGGSSGGGGTAAATLEITAANAEAVVRMVIGGSGNADDALEFVGELFSEIDLSQTGENTCDTGQFTVEFTDTSPQEELNAGDNGSVTFTVCVFNGDEINGSMTFRVNSASGTGVSIAFTVDDLSTDGLTLDANMTLEVNETEAESRAVVRGSRLESESGGASSTLLDFRWVETVDEDTEEFSITFSGTVSNSMLDGTVRYETLTPFEGADDQNPSSGQMRITGANGSVLLLTAIEGGNIFVETDADGDGEFESGFTTTWSVV
jgi:hypothetical protein